MIELVLANARIVTRDEVLTGAVRIENRRITALDPGAVVAAAAVDLEGDYLVPGLVELHTDVLEQHAAPRPGVRWPAPAAVLAHDAQIAASGITTVLNSLAVGYVVTAGERPRDPRPLIEAIHAARAASALKTDHLLHLRCEVSTEHVVADFEPLAADPLVRLVSLMDHTPGQRQFASVEKYREYNQGKFGLSDEQTEALIARRLADRGRYAEAHRASIVRSCQALGLPLASHDDATVAHVEKAAKEGAAIAEFPTTREAARAARAYGLAVVAGAPNLVLGGSHSGNIAAADLAGEGLLDILSSDYVPSSALHGAFLLHLRHGAALPEALATVTATPATRIGLDDRGEITPGLRADLVRVRVVGELPVVISVWRQGARIV